jgi:hypothetical protein
MAARACPAVLRAFLAEEPGSTSSRSASTAAARRSGLHRDSRAAEGVPRQLPQAERRSWLFRPCRARPQLSVTPLRPSSTSATRSGAPR